jgi:hypothetical protein
MDWELSKSSWKDSKPLGNAAIEFLLENSEWVVYLRKDLNLPCINCYDFATKSANTNIACVDCLGTGFKVDKIITAARFWAGGQSSIADQMVRDEAGHYLRDIDTVFFGRNMYPKEGDIVFRCQWNLPTKEIGKNPKAKPVQFSNAYLIGSVNISYEREISFVQCGLKDMTIDLHEYTSHLRRFNNFSRVLPEGKWTPNKYW